MWCFFSVWLVLFVLTVLHAYAAWFNPELFIRLSLMKRLGREWYEGQNDKSLAAGQVMYPIGILFLIALAVYVIIRA